MPKAKKAEQAHQALYHLATAEKRGKAAQRVVDCAAFDAMCADPKRAPRKPPSLRNEAPKLTAAQAALREDIRKGIYTHASKMTWDA